MSDALARIRERRAERIAKKVSTTRSCDGCDLCCTAPSIKVLDKPPATPCAHLCGEAGASCSIYAKRPQICRDFHCLWRQADHILPDYLQPKRCGFMLCFNNLHQWPGVVTVHVDPARPDAWRTPWAQTVFATLAEQWNCLVAIGEVPICSHLFCPDGSRISIADYPSLMFADKGSVGAPDFVFGPDRRPLAERLRETWFDWKLAPPPEAVT